MNREELTVSRSLAERTEAMFRSIDPAGQLAVEWKAALTALQSREAAPSATGAMPVAWWTCAYNGRVRKPCKVCDCAMKGYTTQAAPVEEGAMSEVVPTVETLSEMAYLLDLVPRGEIVPIQFLEILKRQFVAAQMADRATDEFDAARAAIAKAEGK